MARVEHVSSGPRTDGPRVALSSLVLIIRVKTARLLDELMMENLKTEQRKEELLVEAPKGGYGTKLLQLTQGFPTKQPRPLDGPAR